MLMKRLSCHTDGKKTHIRMQPYADRTDGQEFINDLFTRCGANVDLQYCKVVFVGGGAILLKRQIETSGKVSTILRTENQCKCGWL